jgi:two-component system CheB/CheR fusion protein
LQLTDLKPEREKRVAIDLFFRSLADTHGPHAAPSIVLSGADGDGALSCEVATLPSGAGAAHSNHDTRIYLRRERPRMGT